MAKSLKNMMGAGIGAGTATLINGTVADGLTATGSGQADALILTNDVNVVGTVPLGTGVRLLANPQPGDETLVTNLGANTLAIYPPLGATISGAPVNLPFSLPTGNTAEFIARNGSANWVALSSGGTAPTPPSTSPLALGVNMSIPNWYVYSTPFIDTAYSAPGFVSFETGGFSGSTTGNPIPDANRDANGNVKSLPGGEAGVKLVCQLPPTLAQRRLSWTSKLGGSNQGCATMTTPQGASGVTVDLVNRTVTYTPTNTADGSASTPPTFVYTMVSSTDYPIGFTDRPVVDSGAVLTPEFTSLIPVACSAAPVIRFMDWTTVNRHNSPIGASPTGKTISSITFAGTLATVAASTAHGLLGNGTGSGSASVTVSGATPATYNVTDAYVKVISPTQFQYTMGGTPTGNATVVGSYAVGDADAQWTNLHYPVTANEPGVQFGEPIYTSANRNKNKADAEWHDGVQLESIVSLCTALGASPYYPAAQNADSTFYADVASVLATFAASTGKPVYQSVGNEPWNSGFKFYHQLRNEANLRGTLGDALAACRLVTTTNVGLSGLAAIDGFTPIAGDRILVVGQSTASQNGVYVAAAGAWSRAADTLAFRDIWSVTTGLTQANTSWFISTQGAIVAGTTALTITQIVPWMRYAERVIEVANAFRTAFASAGVSSLLNVVAEWQNYASTTIWDDMAAFIGPTDWAKITHLAVAPYYGDNSQMGISAAFTGPDATLKAAMSADIDATLTHFVSHVTYAIAQGKKGITYEGGSTVSLSDTTYKRAWSRGTNAYDLELRFLQQMEIRAASLQTGGLTHAQYNLFYPLGGDAFSWGLIEGLTQTRSKATTPKLQAHTDFLAGVRVLENLVYPSLSVGTNAADGITFGAAPTKSALGVSYSLANDDSGRVSINPTTGQLSLAAGHPALVAGSRSCTVRQTLAGASNSPFDQSVSYTVTVPLNNTHAYRYYRLIDDITPPNGGMAMSEVEIAATPGGADTTFGMTTTSSTTNGTNFAFQAIDDNTGTFWADDQAHGAGEWWQIDYGASSGAWIAANEFRMNGLSSATWPTAFRWQGSDNGSTWTTLKTVSGFTYASGLQTFTV